MRPMFELADRVVEDLVELSPMWATHLGVPGSDDIWDDLSPEGAARMESMLRKRRADIDALPDVVDRWDRLARASAVEWIDHQLDEFEQGENLRNLDSVFSPFQAIRETLELMPTETAEQGEAVASRLERLGDALSGHVATLEKGRAAGLVAARRQAEAVAAQARVQAGRDSSYGSLAERLDLVSPPPGLRHRLHKAVKSARRASGEFAEYLEQSYAADALEQDAVGPERYALAARGYLGMALDPAETYAWGWEEIDRLLRRARATAAVVDPQLSLPEVIELLRTDPALSARTHQDFLRMMDERQQRALADLAGSHFDVPDEIRRVTVNLSPPGGALGAYYQGPSEDFTRPGGIWYSLPAEPAVPLYEEVSIAYHEGFPGHHLQVGMQMAIADRLSRLQRSVIWYPGSGEGWALYAERLMDELGFFERPAYVLGMLVSHLLRAVRVVVDIGSHLGFEVPAGAPLPAGSPWDFARCVDALERLAFQPTNYAESEVTRYLGAPAQAIAYKIGERVILDLRESARSKMGDGFDLKDFHSRVLEVGPVGLELLQKVLGNGW